MNHAYRRMFAFPEWRLRATPFAELGRMRQQMDRLIEGFGDTPFNMAKAGVFPLINLSEDAESYHIRAELPGVTADALDIQATEKGISVSGERKIATEGKDAKYHRREREAGRFSRMVGLPGAINTEKVEANLVNGILNVVVPKAEAAKPRHIAVN